MATTRIVHAPALDFGTIRAEFGLDTPYPPDAVAQARDAVDRFAAGRVDHTDLPLVTIDPPGSMDLDQAVHIVRDGAGFVLHYAIADVAAVVEPGGPLDVESRRRGQTYYLPDGSVPLHPRALSEGSASLLPDAVRPAALWRIALDAAAEPTSVSVERALVRSVARLDYEGVQADVDAGQPHPSVAALPEFGALRERSARARGAIELRLPEQEVVEEDGGWRLRTAPRTSVDDWNAEVSLLVGMCAARLMLDAGVGLIRTLPPADPEAVETMRRTAAALGLAWPADIGPGEFLAGLPADEPATLAMMSEAPKLLRGAGYAAFDGAVPEQTSHGAIGAPYAHVTAPLRRLGDRFATEVCLAVTAGTAVPGEVRSALADVAEVMSSTDSVAGKVTRECIDLAEATVLAGRVGERFEAAVLRAAEGKRAAEVFVPSETVIGACDGDVTEGETVQVTLVEADPTTRTVRFGAGQRNPSVAATN